MKIAFKLNKFDFLFLFFTFVIVIDRKMFVNMILLIVFLFNCVQAQFSFDLPIADTVRFKHEYDFIVIGAGSGVFSSSFKKLSQKIAKSEKNVFNFYYLLCRWMCYGQ